MGPRKRKLNVLSPRLAPQGHGLVHKSTFLNDEVAAEMIDDRWPVTPKADVERPAGTVQCRLSFTKYNFFS